MIRFIAWLLGKEYYDKPCRSCRVLQEQLEYERSQNKEMLETLTSLLKPAPITLSSTASTPVGPKGMLWSRRRAELERQDRESIRVKTSSPVIGRPDKDISEPTAEPIKTIDQLEFELGVVEVGEEAS